jgi:hypothetical protein
MPQIHFYATREDLEPVIRAIEDTATFRYARTGLHTSSIYPEYLSALDIPSLGRATGDQAMMCEAYLVVRKSERIAIREIPQNCGGMRYAVDQLVNPRSIVFQSGGVRDGRVVICSRVSTTGQSEEAKAMFRLFAGRLKKSFEKRQAFYVGPSVMRLKEEGFRLTMAVQSPKEYDLA